MRYGKSGDRCLLILINGAFMGPSASGSDWSAELRSPPPLRAMMTLATIVEEEVSEWSPPRSEEHTSELQSLRHLVCRLLLEKKNMKLDNDRQSEFVHMLPFTPRSKDNMMRRIAARAHDSH